jgi:hypothetical protein
MTRPLDREDAATTNNERFEPHELAWNGRRRRGRRFALLGGVLVLGAVAYFTGWYQQLADGRYVSQVRQSVQGLICPAPGPAVSLASTGNPPRLAQ